eukprot:6174710-Pleurochrysis_carterae.AAC.2
MVAGSVALSLRRGGHRGRPVALGNPRALQLLGSRAAHSFRHLAKSPDSQVKPLLSQPRLPYFADARPLLYIFRFRGTARLTLSLSSISTAESSARLRTAGNQTV